MILAFLGPPGSGKGTQAKMLADKLKIPQITLGDILREEVRAKTEIGLRIKALIDAGNLAPDELTIGLTKQRIKQPDCQKGFILDGFPRSIAQAEALVGMLAENKMQLDRVVYFAIELEEVVSRLSKRRSCKNCGAIYHLEYKAPKQAGFCDQCGRELFQRPDDEPSVIRNRFVVYDEQTKPLIDRYRQEGILAELNADLPIAEVFQQLEALVSAL